MVTCFHCNQASAESEYARVVHNKTPLYGPWAGWRMAGSWLVSPDGIRYTPERLRGMAWRQEASNRLNNAVARNARCKDKGLRI